MFTYLIKNNTTGEEAFGIPYNFKNIAVYRTDFMTCVRSDPGCLYKVESKDDWTVLKTIEHDSNGVIAKEIYHNFESWWNEYWANKQMDVSYDIKKIANDSWNAGKNNNSPCMLC